MSELIRRHTSLREASVAVYREIDPAELERWNAGLGKSEAYERTASATGS